MVGTRLFGVSGALALALLAAGCADRPVNPRLKVIDQAHGYRATNHAQAKSLKDTEILLTFSGGGTRAAAFSYGVLEELKRQDVEVKGRPVNLLGEVGFISGVSGGSFTALAYGLYGPRLFDDYPERFLKRDVQGDLLKRALNPTRWPSLWSTGVGRSELAANYYDEILFQGATFGDLIGRPGPLVMASSTDISTGARLAFNQRDFDIICSDLSAVRLSRAAASSSAVPVLLSPVTFNNYGGTCDYQYPAWVKVAEGGAQLSSRLHQRHAEMLNFEDSEHRPYLHLVDGGVADNLGLRTVLERFRAAEVSPEFRKQLGIEDLRRTLLIVVNARSAPRTDWDRSEDGPSAASLLLQSVSVPIDHNSFETLELMNDMLARWKASPESKADGATTPGEPQEGPPHVRLYPVVVSFDDVKDPALRARLMELPTSFSLESADVDLLRKVAGDLLRNSPEFQAFVRDLKETQQAR